MAYNLISVESDIKTSKGTAFGYLTGIMYLAPANISGFEVCPKRSPGCTSACLFTSGNGNYPKVRSARIRKTQLLFQNRVGFLTLLESDIISLIKEATKRNLVPCIRLNGTSDLGWEGIARDLMIKYPTIQFYDYTKIVFRMVLFLKGKMPSNYHLTFSKSEINNNDVKKVLETGGNVAIVFKKVPEFYQSVRVVDGDLNDLRFLDGTNVVVGLKAKGKARIDTSGFVVTA